MSKVCTPSLPLLKERHCHHHPWGQNPWQSFPLESTFFLSPTGLSLGPVLVLLALREHPWPSCKLPEAAPHRLFSHAPPPTGFQPILPRGQALGRWEGAALGPGCTSSVAQLPLPAFSQPPVWLSAGAAKISLRD